MSGEDDFFSVARTIPFVAKKNNDGQKLFWVASAISPFE